MKLGFLAEIVSEVRKDVANGWYSNPGKGVRTPGSVRLSTEIMLKREQGALVVEYKRVSPGSATPRLPARSVPEFIAVTNSPGLAGYSCLATRSRFEGSIADVRSVAAGTGRPLLFKDFVVDPVQIDCAAGAGAAAILLIARLEDSGLLSEPLTDLARRARDCGLEVLLELHTKSELRHAQDVAPEMIGVNVRDLDTLRMEPATAAATLRAATEMHPVLGLSGVGSPEDARQFWSLGVDGILVGSAVARAEDPAAFLRSLSRPAERS
jgi:indole-3-glycerol phosphate synthase